MVRIVKTKVRAHKVNVSFKKKKIHLYLYLYSEHLLGTRHWAGKWAYDMGKSDVVPTSWHFESGMGVQTIN